MGTETSVLEDLYPESVAGGFTHVDSTIAFYSRVNALLSTESVVLDLGAGRGCFLEDSVAYRRDLRRLQGKVARVIGLDVDEAVLTNPVLDEAHVVAVDASFPLADRSVDLIVSDFTFEHVSDPAHVAGEISRVLRPGGWLCARTPNRSGYIGIPTRVVPNRLHDRVLNRVQPDKMAQDTFPTCYRLNTVADLKRHFPESDFEHCSYLGDAEPAYFGSSRAAWRAIRGFSQVVPARYRSVLYVFLRRRSD
jgi:SAM-dependent methyltransferase